MPGFRVQDAKNIVRLIGGASTLAISLAEYWNTDKSLLYLLTYYTYYTYYTYLLIGSKPYVRLQTQMLSSGALEISNATWSYVALSKIRRPH